MGYAPRYDHPPPPCHAAEGTYGPEHHRPACAQCAFHLRTIDGLQRELRRCLAELTKLHYIVAPDALPPPLERADDRLRRPSSPVMFFRPLELSASCSHVLTDGGVGAHVIFDLLITALSSNMSPRRQMSAMQASP